MKNHACAVIMFRSCLVTLLVSYGSSVQAATSKANFAGGCFWCMEEAFENTKGVVAVTTGYQGGTLENPNYKEVSTGKTGHYETVEVVFDPDVISYPALLKVFWKNIDPVDAEGQFCDAGSQYRSAIFYYDQEQKIYIDGSIKVIKKSK